jgi:aminoglycoside phosphotransferase (APT) family kinase protein
VDRLGLLEQELRAALGVEAITVRAWRSGVDFWADLACTGPEIAGVIRTPRHELLLTSYEGTVDFGAVVETEALVLRLLADGGVPVPRVLDWRRRGAAAVSGRGGGYGGSSPRHDAAVSWLLCEYIEHEQGAELTPDLIRQLGRWTRAIHAIQPAHAGLRPDRPWPEFVLARLELRLRAARSYAGALPAGAVLAAAARLLPARAAPATSLLHLDLRAANLCVRAGQIAAIIDVANAMTGDPLLELARIRGYGLLTAEFCHGYGLSAGELSRAGPLLDIYEVDTAAMLTTIAVEEVGDDDLLARSRARLIELCERIARSSGG